ncbi:MAG: ATP-binding cassette domain-containing protein [Pirellulaceae bacterium]
MSICANWTLNLCGTLIGVVFQESFLFSNTIAANIAFGCPDASSEQIRSAASVASAADFVEALPEKYDTILGEFGLSLSGGQRQRLAVARAILHEPKILLLDDPAASLDPETESEIMTELQAAATGRTSLLVAHRLSSIRRADRIVVLDGGRIVQVGSHQQLMEEANVYQQMAISQGYSPEPSASRFDPVPSRSRSD